MLVVIDVQKRFAPESWFVDKIVEEIWRARKRKEPVVIVRYGAKSRHLKKIAEAVRGYKYLSVSKEEDDGGSAIFHGLNRCSNRLTYKLGTGAERINLDAVKSIKVCGMNTSACVMKTVRTLSYLRYPVKVLADACWNNLILKDDVYNITRHVAALKRMGSWKNVEVVW